MEFAQALRSARAAALLTQAEVAEASGIARPNITAYETGNREPRYSSAQKVLEAVGAKLLIKEPVTWHWTVGRRPYAVPSRLWHLPPHQALAKISTDQHLWWSGPPRQFDLIKRGDRLRAYEIVLREGTPLDIEPMVDEVLLVEAWNDLVLPAELRQAWASLIDHDDSQQVPAVV